MDLRKSAVRLKCVDFAGFAGFAAIQRFRIQNPSKSSVAEVGDAPLERIYGSSKPPYFLSP
jgi:hypothetical protein